jgi:hypothetical protein
MKTILNTFRFQILIYAVIGVFQVCAAEPFADNFDSGVADPKFWQYDQKGECEIDVGSPGADQPVSAVRFRAGRGARCELVPRVFGPRLFGGYLGDLRREPYNKDRWYTFRVFLEEPWKLSEKNEVIAQWHSTRDEFLGDTNGRGPPLALRIIDGYFRLSYGWDANLRSTRKHLARYTLWYGPLITGEWIDWRIRARWSYDEDGLLQIWQNGRLIVDHHGPNAYNDIRGVYLKIGSYHPAEPRTVFFDDVYIGDAEPGSAYEDH